MKRVVLFIVFLFSMSLTYSQTIYVWEPEDFSIALRPLFEQTDTIDLVIFDGRVIPDKVKGDFASEDLILQVVEDLQKIYSGATFYVQPAAQYYRVALDKHITIKIGISAYHAGFGRDVDIAIGNVGGNFSYGISPKGKWNAITSMYVKLYDKRGSSNQEYEKSIFSQVEKPNMGGYMTAKKCLNQSYSDVMNQLVFFIDNAFMQN